MLVNIAVSELRLGMYIDEFCGPGIENTMWKHGFFLQNEHDVQRIQNGKIPSVWINVCKGKHAETTHSYPPAFCLANPSYPHQPSIAYVSFTEEAAQAKRICARAKTAVEAMFKDIRLGRIIQTDQIASLVHDLSTSVMRNAQAVISLARLKTSDDYTYMHSVAVCALMIALARQLGLPSSLVQEAGTAGLMHDIGKAAIPVMILSKPGKLCDTEYETVRQHPVEGVRILQNNPMFSRHVLDVCLHHHEKIDGSGYPNKLAGSQISVLARMAAICDVYDAITSNRPYKSAWDPAESIHRMAEWKGHFDTRIFQAFVKCVGIYPVGSVVRLDSGKVGVVTEQNSPSLLRPKIKTFFCARREQYIPVTELDLSEASCTDFITGREHTRGWNLKHMENLWAHVS